MPKTTADVPPGAASEFKRARSPDAIADATATGYTTTKTMNPAKARPSQYGLPKSGKGMKSPAMRSKKIGL
jgi:hypothetical protein